MNLIPYKMTNQAQFIFPNFTASFPYLVCASSGWHTSRTPRLYKPSLCQNLINQNSAYPPASEPIFFSDYWKVPDVFIIKYMTVSS